MRYWIQIRETKRKRVNDLVTLVISSLCMLTVSGKFKNRNQPLFTGIERIRSGSKDRRTISPCDRSNSTKRWRQETIAHEDKKKKIKPYQCEQVVLPSVGHSCNVSTSGYFKQASTSISTRSGQILAVPVRIHVPHSTLVVFYKTTRSQSINLHMLKDLLSLLQVNYTVSAYSFASFRVPYSGIIIFGACENEITVLVVFHSCDGPFMSLQKYGLLKKKDVQVRIHSQQIRKCHQLTSWELIRGKEVILSFGSGQERYVTTIMVKRNIESVSSHHQERWWLLLDRSRGTQSFADLCQKSGQVPVVQTFHTFLMIFCALGGLIFLHNNSTIEWSTVSGHERNLWNGRQFVFQFFFRCVLL